MKDMRAQYQHAYDSDNSRYSYRQDDGTVQTYIAGEDGVTEEWIALLKIAHREERNLMRRGTSDADGAKAHSLDRYQEDGGDRSAILAMPQATDTTADFSQLLQQALEQLSLSEREIILRVSLMGDSKSKLAREYGVSPPVISKKIRRARRKLRFFLAQKSKYLVENRELSRYIIKK